MESELRHVDITHVPEIREIIDEVRRSDQPRILRADDVDVAIIVPLPVRKTRPTRRVTAKDHEAFLSSAGGWEGLVDTEELKANVAESRRRSHRPPVDL